MRPTAVPTPRSLTAAAAFAAASYTAAAFTTKPVAISSATATAVAVTAPAAAPLSDTFTTFAAFAVASPAKCARQCADRTPVCASRASVAPADNAFHLGGAKASVLPPHRLLTNHSP